MKAGRTYIYLMLLLKLGWMVSGYHRKIYMTKAQLRLAKTGHALFWMVEMVEGEKTGWVGKDGMVEKGEVCGRAC